VSSDGRVAWAAVDVDGLRGEDADRIVPAASTIKVAITVAFWSAVAAGAVDPGARPAALELTGDGSILDLLPGIEPTYAHCATLMLAVSDNAATNAIIDVVGLDGVQAACDRLGMTRTRIRRRMADEVARAAGIENETTAGDLARMMLGLVGPAVPVSSRVRILTDLAGSHHLDVCAEALTGIAAEVYPKAGELDTARHDCALLRLGGRAIGVAVCSSPAVSPDRLRLAVRAAVLA
jgi:beta-lactamase class A